MMMERMAVKVRMGEPVPFAWVGLDWHVAVVNGRRDEEAREWLEARGVPVFMVEGSRIVRSAGRLGPRCRMVRYRPFEGYLFVAGRERVQRVLAGWQWDRRTRGMECPVRGLLGAGGEPSRVNGFAMQALFAAHEGGWFSRPQASAVLPVRIGESVKVARGPFAELDAVVTAIVNRDEVEIIAKLFGREMPARVRLDSIVKVRP